MTAFVLAILHGVGSFLAILFLIFIGLFILGVCLMVALCSFFCGETNGYQQRFRLPKQRAPRRTLIITPDHRDPNIVGDVSQAHWPKATYPHSRANVKGEGVMARALYNRDTLATIRGLTIGGKGVHVIAREIEWTVQELRTVGARRSIPLIEDDPEGKPKPIARVAVAVTETDSPREKPRGSLLKTDCTGVKRGHGVTLLISRAAVDAGREVAISKGIKPGAVLAIALDHACRTGRLRALFDEAMAGAK